jgi:hypothetical protein
MKTETLSNAHLQLLETIQTANLTESESKNLGIALRRIIDKELTTQDMEEFVHTNDAPTREEAFAALAIYKPMPQSTIEGNGRKGVSV